MTGSSLTDELLSHGRVDSIQLIDVIDAVCRHHGLSLSDEPNIMRLALDVIRELLEAEYLYAGDAVTSAAGSYTVCSWGLDPPDALSRIKEKWLELGRQPDLGDVVWFELTDQGKAQARKLQG
jgi:hypothetical protein